MSKSKSVLEQITQTDSVSFIDQQKFTTELQKYYKGLKENNKKFEWTTERILCVMKLLDGYNLAKRQGRRATNKEYHHAKKYDVMNVGNEKVLIVKRKSPSDPVVQIIPSTEYFQRILDTHIATGHGRRDKIVHAFKDKYLIPIIAVTIFLKLCKTCLSKKRFCKSEIIVKPLSLDDFSTRGQLDLIDFQTSPDNEYKFLLQYQEHLTKFCFLRPLRSKEAKEVAFELLKVFLEVGCPYVLQSDNGCEFTATVLKEIVSLWPACKIVNGRPRCQGSIEQTHQDVRNMIQKWMVDNNSRNWSIGCYFVQFHKNSSYHSSIGRSPYKALFGEEPKLGLSSTHLSKDIISKLDTEEELEILFEETNDKTASTISNASGFQTAQDNVGENHCNEEASRARKCLNCKNIFHTICEVLNEDEGYEAQLCNLCRSEGNIAQHRKESCTNLKRAAEKTISSNKIKNKRCLDNKNIDTSPLRSISTGMRHYNRKIAKASSETCNSKNARLFNFRVEVPVREEVPVKEEVLDDPLEIMDSCSETCIVPDDLPEEPVIKIEIDEYPIHVPRFGGAADETCLAGATLAVEGSTKLGTGEDLSEEAADKTGYKSSRKRKTSELSDFQVYTHTSLEGEGTRGWRGLHAADTQTDDDAG